MDEHPQLEISLDDFFDHEFISASTVFKNLSVLPASVMKIREGHHFPSTTKA
jgi:hypothetical protein